MGETVHTKNDSVRLNLKLLDGFTATMPTGEIVKISNKKACCLLSYLALSKSGVESRERLAGLLWSEHSESQARASLRQCLKQLRSAFELCDFDGFTTDRQNAALSLGMLEIDIVKLQSSLHQAKIPNDLKLKTGSPARLLYGYENLDQSFSTWLHVIRRNWQDQFIHQLQELMRSPDHLLAKSGAEAMLILDPSHEEAHRHIITHHANSANTGAALKQYKSLWDLLDVEFDMEPDLKTQTLIAEIKSGTYENSPQEPQFGHQNQPAPINRTSGLPVIEIHPFEVGGPSDIKEYFIQGFRHDLIAHLVRFRDWVVVEGQNSHNGKSSENENVSISDYKVEATYLTSDDQVFITITLADARTWRYIWSDRYTLSPENWAKTQQQIAARIAAAMDIYLSTDGINRQSPQRDLTLNAYDLWLRGQNLLLDWRAKNEAEAEDLFKQVIELMPSFAPAYSSLANIYNTRHIVTAGYFRQPELGREALRLARRSIELDPLDCRAQLTLAWSYAMASRFDQAEIHFELAYKLNSSNPGNLISCAHGWAFCDKPAEALRLSNAALILNPSPEKYFWGYLVGIRVLGGDYEGAIEAIKNSDNVILDLPGWAAIAYAHSDLTQKARQAGEDLIKLVRQNWHGNEECNAKSICNWFLNALPIKSTRSYKMVKKGLQLAGLPA